MLIEQGASRARALGRRRAQDLDALALAVQHDLEPGAGMRDESADMIVHLAGRPRPVDAGLARIDLLGVSDACAWLRAATEAATLERLEGFDREPRAKVREGVLQLPCPHVCAHG